jgi:hypothetical protein
MEKTLLLKVKTMKKIIIILIMFNIACYTNEKEIEIKQMYDYTFENEIEVKSLREALDYVSETIKYQLEKIGFDYWKTPEETYSSKKGDCEDFSMLLLYIAWTMLDIDDCYLVKVNFDDEDTKHTIVRINGFYYAPQTGYKIWVIDEKLIEWEVHYTEAIWMTVNYHDSIGKYN